MTRRDSSSSAKLRIGALEERTGLTRDAIHHYVREGLISPPEKQSATVAWYDQRHVAKLRSIRVLREAGLPIAAVKRLLDDPSVAALSSEALSQLGSWLVAVGVREVPRATVCSDEGRSLSAALRLADRVDENPALAESLSTLARELTPTLVGRLERELMPSLRAMARAHLEQSESVDIAVTERVVAAVAASIGALFAAAVAEALTARALASRKRTSARASRTR